MCQGGGGESQPSHSTNLQSSSLVCQGTVFESMTTLITGHKNRGSALRPHRPEQPDRFLVSFSTLAKHFEKQADILLSARTTVNPRESAPIPHRQGIDGIPEDASFAKIWHQTEHDMIQRVQYNMALVDEWRSSHNPANAVNSTQSKTARTLPNQMADAIFELEELQELRRQHMTAIHLQMKTSVVDYYQNEYARAFPDTPAPALFQQTVSQPQQQPWNDVPQLAPSDELSSKSSTSSISMDSLNCQNTFPIQLVADESSFMNLAFVGSLGLSPRKRCNDSPATSLTGSRSSGRSSLKSPDHYLILLDTARNVPVGIVAAKVGSGPPVLRVYATKPRVPGQKQSASTEDLGLSTILEQSFPLYPWAEIVTRGKLRTELSFELFMATGSNGQYRASSSYRTSFSLASAKESSPQPKTVVEITGRTDKETFDSGCALFSFLNSPLDRQSYLQIDVASGIDPALMLCFASSIVEIVEAGMQRLCRRRQREDELARTI